MMTHVFLENEALFPFVSFNSSDTPEACFETEPRTALKGCLFVVFRHLLLLRRPKLKNHRKNARRAKKKPRLKSVGLFVGEFLCVLILYNHRDVFEDFHWLHVFVVDFHFQSEGLNGRCCSQIGH